MVNSPNAISRHVTGRWSKDRHSAHHRQSAAYAQDLTGDVIGALAEEKQHRLGDILGLGDAAEWNRPGQRFFHAVRLTLEQRRVGRTGANTIDVELVPRHLARQRFGEGNKPALSRGI